MIHLDTNFLIGVFNPGSVQHLALDQWIAQGELIGISAVAWGEFLCGPLLPDQANRVAAWISNFEPLLADDGAFAADLFNKTGRRRGTFADCLIAATAIRRGALLATLNVSDFGAFVPLGLQLRP